MALRFFSSKGRVAGLFAVIGLLAVAIFFVAITTMVRHRRAKQIDKDVVEAAKEAGAASHSANFDDYQDSPHTGYSTDSRAHLDHRSAGVAGIGLVGGAAAAMQRARDHRDFTAASAPDDYPAFDDRIPYPAFAGHGLQPHEMYDRSGVHSNPDANAFEAAATPGAFTNRHSSSDRKHISRNSSQGSMGLISEASVYSTASAGESYAAHYRSGYDAAQKPHPPLPPPQQQQVLYTTGGLSGGYAQEDPFQSPRLPKPSGPYDANPDDMMGAEHAGDREGHSRREGEGRVGFEEEDGDDYKRLPWVLRVRTCCFFRHLLVLTSFLTRLQMCNCCTCCSVALQLSGVASRLEKKLGGRSFSFNCSLLIPCLLGTLSR